MSIQFTQSFKKKMIRLIKKQPFLQRQFKKQLELFQQNRKHRGLRLHKLRGQRSEQYAIWIWDNIRALAVKSEDVFIFFDIVTHDQY